MPSVAKLHLVYLPGLGDSADPLRKLWLGGYWGDGITVSLVPMMWRSGDDTIDAKLDRIRKAIGRIPAERTVLVGESAGAAMAVIALQCLADQVDGVVSICGKHLHGDTVGAHVYRRNPSFRSVIERGEAVVQDMSVKDKAKLGIIYSSHDGFIPAEDTLISGVKAVDIRTHGHKRSIIKVLLFRRRLITQLAQPKET